MLWFHRTAFFIKTVGALSTVNTGKILNQVGICQLTARHQNQLSSVATSSRSCGSEAGSSGIIRVAASSRTSMSGAGT
jgi:hypothetical protein